MSHLKLIDKEVDPVKDMTDFLKPLKYASGFFRTNNILHVVVRNEDKFFYSADHHVFTTMTSDPIKCAIKCAHALAEQ